MESLKIDSHSLRTYRILAFLQVTTSQTQETVYHSGEMAKGTRSSVRLLMRSSSSANAGRSSWCGSPERPQALHRPGRGTSWDRHEHPRRPPARPRAGRDRPEATATAAGRGEGPTRPTARSSREPLYALARWGAIARSAYRAIPAPGWLVNAIRATCKDWEETPRRRSRSGRRRRGRDRSLRERRAGRRARILRRRRRHRNRPGDPVLRCVARAISQRSDRCRRDPRDGQALRRRAIPLALQLRRAAVTRARARLRASGRNAVQRSPSAVSRSPVRVAAAGSFPPARRRAARRSRRRRRRDGRGLDSELVGSELVDPAVRLAEPDRAEKIVESKRSPSGVRSQTSGTSCEQALIIPSLWPRRRAPRGVGSASDEEQAPRMSSRGGPASPRRGRR